LGDQYHPKSPKIANQLTLSRKIMTNKIIAIAAKINCFLTKKNLSTFSFLAIIGLELASSSDQKQ
jgi:preprotein translocase subunit SecF